MVNAINAFLTDTKQKIKDLSDEDFKVQVEAVKTEVSEKDINMKKDNERMWSEIGLHKYNFARQQEEIDALETFNKADVIDHFMNTFFGVESKRLDLELTSAAHTDQNEEYKLSNSKHEIYEKKERSVFSIDDFKN